MVVNNPNNWHWVDKNCIDWTKTYFNDNLVGLSAVESPKKVAIDKVSSIEGDVEVSQRKGKVISLFDLKLILGFSGQVEEGKEVKGSILIPELAYDSSEDDLQFEISIFNEDSSNEAIAPFIKANLLPQLRQILIKFGVDLIITNSADIQLPSEKVSSTFTKANQEASIKKDAASKVSSETKAAATSTATPTTQKTTSGASIPRYNTTTLYLEPTFNTTAEQLYITLLDEARIAAWSRSFPIIEKFPPSVGSDYKFFGGSVNGKIIKLVPNEHIVELWRLDDWKSGHYAELDIQLVQGAGETKMTVKFTGIPIGEEDRVRGNFEDYYIRSIKTTFGFGAVL
ncbi:activator of Hsp90 ATPase [Scheffersomyces xylosifermentans]|uniref:activator of Hsp90 ATPase n=1 Tax=Scheffersomyces xylosifermentans TaxID=1304137 RepID=UPI00315DDE70